MVCPGLSKRQDPLHFGRNGARGRQRVPVRLELRHNVSERVRGVSDEEPPVGCPIRVYGYPQNASLVAIVNTGNLEKISQVVKSSGRVRLQSDDSPNQGGGRCGVESPDVRLRSEGKGVEVGSNVSHSVKAQPI